MSESFFIPKSLHIHGDIKGTVSGRIEGKLTGNVIMEEGSKVIVSETAEIEGNIYAAHLQISGQVCGDIISTDSLVLHANAAVMGNISANHITIHPEATVVGSILKIANDAKDAYTPPMLNESIVVSPKGILEMEKVSNSSTGWW